MSFCIFMASRTATTSPSLTASPTFTGTFTIRPGAGAAAAGSTATPAPATRTWNTSPSTSTSNSAATACGAGGGSGGGAAASEAPSACGASSAGLEELEGERGEQQVRQDALVVGLDAPLAELGARRLDLGVEEVGRADRDRLLLAQHLPAHLYVGRAGRGAVEALE